MEVKLEEWEKARLDKIQEIREWTAKMVRDRELEKQNKVAGEGIGVNSGQDKPAG